MEVDRLKKLLGITDDGQDERIRFVIDDVEETVKNYCNTDTVPPGLENTCYRMAVDLYRYDLSGECGAPVLVASVSEGDTSTSFTNAADALSGGILKDYRGQLNRHRKVGW